MSADEIYTTALRNIKGGLKAAFDDVTDAEDWLVNSAKSNMTDSLSTALHHAEEAVRRIKLVQTAVASQQKLLEDRTNS